MNSSPDPSVVSSQSNPPYIWVPRSRWGARAPKDKFNFAKPSRIVIHETSVPTQDHYRSHGAEATIRGIQNYHMDNPATKWSDIGYNALVSPDGDKVFEGRPWDAIGAHCGGNKGRQIMFSNTGSIGISLIGDYRTVEPTPGAMATIRYLINMLCAKFGIKPTEVYGHFEAAIPSPKPCPGKTLAHAFPGMGERFDKAYPKGG